MKHKIGIIAGLFAALTTLIGLVACAHAAPASTPSPSTSSPITSSTSVPITFDITSITSASVDGLSLSLSLNSATLQPGQEIAIVIDEKNTLSATNKVAASGNWPLKGLNVGPCGILNYPLGVAISQGYYTSANISSATPLKLYDPGAIYNCPMILSAITSYVFQPSSNVAAIFGSCDPNPCLTTDMNARITATGYYSGNPKAMLNTFTPGVYTVFGADEWGTSAVLHFIVSR